MIILYLLIVVALLFYLFVQSFILKKYINLNAREKYFVASLSHDLKSPTLAQINMLNLLLNGYFGELNPKQYEMVKLTCGSSRYVSNLVGNILTDYELDSKAFKLHKSEFYIKDLILSVCAQNEFLSKEKKQKIIFNCSSNIGKIYADELQIQRVISNFLSNAIKYSYPNSEIIINLNKINNLLKFSISNKSNPIPRNELEHIFEKFTKTQNSSLAKSSNGLGLYVAKTIIDLHGGKIYAKSLSDGTCIFGFRLKIGTKDSNLAKTN